MATDTTTAATTTVGGDFDFDDERVQTIVLMRHGVAAHNFEGADLCSPSLLDPPLTLHGKMGAIQAGDKIRTWWKAANNNPNYDGCSVVGNHSSIDLIVTSPLTRCLQTTMHAFLPGDDYGDDCRRDDGGDGAWIPIVCLEHLREACGKHYPDKRREKSVLLVSHFSYFFSMPRIWVAPRRLYFDRLQLHLILSIRRRDDFSRLYMLFSRYLVYCYRNFGGQWFISIRP
jgi:hypothetical protein